MVTLIAFPPVIARRRSRRSPSFLPTRQFQEAEITTFTTLAGTGEGVSRTLTDNRVRAFIAIHPVS